MCMIHFQNMVIYCSIFLNLPKALMNEMCPSSLILKKPHTLELLRTENVSLTNGKAKLFFFSILTFECLKSVTNILSCVIFLLINITRLEYGENLSFNTCR